MPTTVDIESQRMLVGTTPVRKIYQGTNLIGTRIAELFANGEQGVWYDPSDLSTLFQDSAGTLPVTAMEQPVGLMLDKSGRGNHAVQATTTARPVVSARYNLLTKTEFAGGLADAATQGGNVAATTFPEFAGGVAFTGNSVTSYVYQSPGTLIVGVGVVLSVYVIMDDGNAPVVAQSSTTGDFSGVIETSASGITASVVNISGPLYRVSFTKLATTGGMSNSGIVKYNTQSSRTFKITGYDLRYISGAALPPYQRVTSATDYATAGFPVYLNFDGIDDYLVTLSTLPPSNDVTVIVGAKKGSNNRGMVVCNNADPVATLNAYSIELPSAAGTTLLSRMRGTGTGRAAYGNVPDNHLSVASAELSATAGNQRLRNNGALFATDTASVGEGPITSGKLSIGGTPTGTVLFKGAFYGTLISHSILGSAQLNAVTQYMRNKSRAY